MRCSTPGSGRTVASMDLDLAALPQDVDALHRLIRELAAKRASEQKALTEAQAEIERLRVIVKKLQRLQFGRRAERLDGTSWSWGWRIWAPISVEQRQLLPVRSPWRGTGRAG